ncbi:uncharacterized protein A4U43_C08F23660 [Asparagus officinalis]|nr:uncharacterized protein A4U43_C08F23660 [Asparagus officinalis]
MSGPDEPIKLRNIETFETAQAQNPIRQRPREMIRRNIETYKIPARANAAWYLAVQLVTSQIDIDQALTFEVVVGKGEFLKGLEVEEAATELVGEAEGGERDFDNSARLNVAFDVGPVAGVVGVLGP